MSNILGEEFESANKEFADFLKREYGVSASYTPLHEDIDEIGVVEEDKDPQAKEEALLNSKSKNAKGNMEEATS